MFVTAQSIWPFVPKGSLWLPAQLIRRGTNFLNQLWRYQRMGSKGRCQSLGHRSCDADLACIVELDQLPNMRLGQGAMLLFLTTTWATASLASCPCRARWGCCLHYYKHHPPQCWLGLRIDLIFAGVLLQVTNVRTVRFNYSWCLVVLYFQSEASPSAVVSLLCFRTGLASANRLVSDWRYIYQSHTLVVPWGEILRFKFLTVPEVGLYTAITSAWKLSPFAFCETN